MTRLRQMSVIPVLLFVVALGSGSMAKSPQEEVLTPEEFRAAADLALSGKTVDLEIEQLELRLPDGDEPYAGIEGDELYRYAGDICEFSRQSREGGDLLWGRICGRPAERRAAEYVKAKFDEFGLEQVRIEEFEIPNPQWWPSEFELALVDGSAPGAPQQDYRFKTAFASYQAGVTPPEGVEAPVEYIGLGTEADLFGRDLEGKIALVYSIPLPCVFIHTAQEVVPRLAREGKALGVIVAIQQAENERYAARCGTGSERIPYLVIGREDGRYLRRVIEASGPQAAPRVRMKVRGKMLGGWTSQNVFGLLRGTTDEYVVVIAHLDGWFEAANDNASGLAALLGLARHFSQEPPEERRRNLLFVATAGHHSYPACGVVNLIQRHREILDSAVMVVNIEHMGAVNAHAGIALEHSNRAAPSTLMITNQSPLLFKLFLDAIGRYGIHLNNTSSPDYWGDLYPFRPLGVTGVSLMQDFLWYHTEQDTLEHLSAPALERVTRAFALVLDRVDDVSRQEIERGAKPPLQQDVLSELTGAVGSLF